MARQGRFGTLPSSAPDLTMTIVALYEAFQDSRDQNIYNAWLNGGNFEGSKVTDKRLMKWYKDRRDQFAKDDPQWDYWNQRHSRLGFDVEESKVLLAHEQGKMSVQEVSRWYKQNADRFPKASEAWRQAMLASARYRKAGQETASAGRQASRTSGYEARINAIERSHIQPAQKAENILQRALVQAGILSPGQHIGQMDTKTISISDEELASYLESDPRGRRLNSQYRRLTGKDLSMRNVAKLKQREAAGRRLQAQAAKNEGFDSYAPAYRNEAAEAEALADDYIFADSNVTDSVLRTRENYVQEMNEAETPAERMKARQRYVRQTAKQESKAAKLGAEGYAGRLRNDRRGASGGTVTTVESGFTQPEELVVGPDGKMQVKEDYGEGFVTWAPAEAAAWFEHDKMLLEGLRDGTHVQIWDPVQEAMNVFALDDMPRGHVVDGTPNLDEYAVLPTGYDAISFDGGEGMTLDIEANPAGTTLHRKRPVVFAPGWDGAGVPIGGIEAKHYKVNGIDFWEYVDEVSGELVQSTIAPFGDGEQYVNARGADQDRILSQGIEDNQYVVRYGTGGNLTARPIPNELGGEESPEAFAMREQAWLQNTLGAGGVGARLGGRPLLIDQRNLPEQVGIYDRGERSDRAWEDFLRERAQEADSEDFGTWLNQQPPPIRLTDEQVQAIEEEVGSTVPDEVRTGEASVADFLSGAYDQERLAEVGVDPATVGPGGRYVDPDPLAQLAEEENAQQRGEDRPALIRPEADVRYGRPDDLESDRRANWNLKVANNEQRIAELQDLESGGLLTEKQEGELDRRQTEQEEFDRMSTWNVKLPSGQTLPFEGQMKSDGTPDLATMDVSEFARQAEQEEAKATADRQRIINTALNLTGGDPGQTVAEGVVEKPTIISDALKSPDSTGTLIVGSSSLAERKAFAQQDENMVFDHVIAANQWEDNPQAQAQTARTIDAITGAGQSGQSELDYYRQQASNSSFFEAATSAMQAGMVRAFQQQVEADSQVERLQEEGIFAALQGATGGLTEEQAREQFPDFVPEDPASAGLRGKANIDGVVGVGGIEQAQTLANRFGIGAYVGDSVNRMNAAVGKSEGLPSTTGGEAPPTTTPFRAGSRPQTIAPTIGTGQQGVGVPALDVQAPRTVGPRPLSYKPPVQPQQQRIRQQSISYRSGVRYTPGKGYTVPKSMFRNVPYNAPGGAGGVYGPPAPEHTPKPRIDIRTAL